MHLEITTAGTCRPWGFRESFPARRLTWIAGGKRIGIDTGYGPAPSGNISLAERLYRRVFRVQSGPRLPPLDDLLLTHYHLDHVGGRETRAACGPRLPQARGLFAELRMATFPRTLHPAPRALPPFDGERFGFPVTRWHDLEVLSLPGHTPEHLGVYFPALDLIYVCDAVWYLSWIKDAPVPRWAVRLQAEPRAFIETLQRLRQASRDFPATRFRCAHDPEQPDHEIISAV